MSTVTRSVGSSWNSSQVQATSMPSRSLTVNSQSSNGIRGVGPADRTGKSAVTYWPGGTRPSGPSSRRRPRKPRVTKLIACSSPSDMGRSCSLSLQRQARRLPVSQPTGVPLHVLVSGLQQSPVKRDAGVTVVARAIDDDLFAGIDRREELLRSVEVLRSGEVLRPERPLVEGHHQPKRVTALDLLPELVPADRPDGLVT